jgi:ribosomal protein S18 acetylase RimI-like enzyme
MTAVTDPFEADGLALHALGPDDAPRGAALSAEIGWNQVEADWRYMLENGAGYGRTNADGKLVASAMSVSHGAFAWVCMVLVSPDYRRRGLASDLMRRVIDDLRARDIVAGLDATPDGREVYKLLGFEDIYRIERMWAARVTPSDENGGTPVRITPMTAAEIDEVAEYDAPGFGADRRALLAHLRDRAPERAFVARAGQWLAGFVLARDGLAAMQLGPVVAEDPDIAIALARHALDGYRGAAVIDIVGAHKSFIEWCGNSGFVYQRPYIRMLLDRTEAMDRSAFIFALAGPELG